MLLVSELDGRYLWVDRLCIPQDDLPVKKLELEKMATIYARAYLTVIASQGRDAEEGLHGIPGGTPRTYSLTSQAFLPPPKDPRQDSAYFSPEDERYERHDPEISSNIAILEQYSRELLDSKWSSRGWTLQEQLFSPRKLVFQNDTVNWECHCVTWHEAQVDLSALALQFCDEEPSAKTTGFSSTTWPDFYLYGRLTCIYNLRNLTYQEDVLDAYAGVLSVLSKSYKGGFVSGLPVTFFDAALLWQPYEPLKRRVASASGVDRGVLPSWSWVGWHGNLQSESWRSGYDYMRRNADEFERKDRNIWRRCSWRTTSTVKWSHSEQLTSERKPIPAVRGDDVWDKSPDSNQALPPGWSREKSEITNQVFFRHESNPQQEFWYPIPILDLESEERGVASMSSRYLHCRTRRAYLNIDDNCSGNSPSKCQSKNLYEEKPGKWAGVLRINDWRWEEGILYSSIAHLPKETKCELIELSKGEVADQETEWISFEEWEEPSCPRKEGMYRFYNVMWIEWNDEIAYRKAIGRVNQDVWERIATEELDVTLG